MTAISQAELLYGVRAVAQRAAPVRALQPPSRECSRKISPTAFLPFDSDAARAMRTLPRPAAQWAGPSPQLDAQIAAIAHSRGATLATRNAAISQHCGIKVLNPWVALA